MNIRLPFVCLLIFLNSLFAVAQDTSISDWEDYEVVVDEVDNEHDARLWEPELKLLAADYPDSQRIKQEYNYMKNLDSLLRNYKTNEAPTKASKSGNTSWLNIGFVRILLWALAIFAVLYILYQLLAGQGNLFYKNKKYEKAPETEKESDIQLSPLQLSQQAALRGEYRQAVRYQYAYLLQLLGEKKYINILPQKTSQHYLRELASKPLASDFTRLTLQYEYVWFGNINPNKEQYDLVNEGYRNFINKWL